MIAYWNGMWSQGRHTLAYLEAAKKFSRLQWLTLSCSFSDISYNKRKKTPLQERKMRDRFRIWAKGGDGGNGCSSLHRSRHDRRGRADGGNGGRGGDVILECSTDVWDFSSLQHHINAKRGGNGAPKNMIGSRGADKVVLVPVGTVIHLVEGELSSSVEKKSSGALDRALDPWDIPGTLDFSSEQSPAVRSRNLEVEDTERCISPPRKETFKESACATQIKSSRFSSSKNNSQNEYAASLFQKAEGNIDYDELNDEAIMSGSENEEDLDETEHIQYNVAELTQPGQQITVARGGNGGTGNLLYAKLSKMSRETDSSVETPDDEEHASCNVGSPGSEAVLLLELKSIADVGLVGMPNAGKSTLLGALSRAKPVVGHYAFTTLRPNLGNVKYEDLSITVADIPGLIRGAHENRGLGHNFLRHIERTKVLAYVVDLAAAIDGRKGIPPWEQLKDLMLELEFYQKGLSNRPSLIVANKIDETGADEVYQELTERVTGALIFPVCAVLEEGIPELRAALKMLVNGEQPQRLSLDSIVLD